MEMFKNIMWEYRFVILVALAIVLFAFLEWNKFKSVCYAAMLQAKSMAKDAILKSGDEQEEWVVKKLLQLLPKTLIIFISEQTLRKLVHYLYNKAKDYLDDGELNNSLI